MLYSSSYEMLDEIRQGFLYEKIFRKILNNFSEILNFKDIILYVMDSNVRGLKPLIGIGKYIDVSSYENYPFSAIENVSSFISIDFSGSRIGALYFEENVEFDEKVNSNLMLTLTLFLNSFIMYRETSAKINKLGTLYEIAKFTDYLVNPSNALYSIIDIVKSIVNYDTCGVYLFENHDLKLRYFHGVVPEVTLIQKNSFFDDVIKNKKTVLSHYKKFKSFIVIPLMLSEKVIGAVTVGSYSSYEYNFDDTVALQIVVTQLSSMDSMFNSLLSVKSVTNNIVNSINQGIITVDLEKKVNLFNHYARTIFPELKKTEELHISALFQLEHPMRKCIENTLEKGMIYEKERVKAGNFVYELNSFVLKNDSQYIMGAGVIFRDISEEVKIEEKLKFKDRISTIGELSASISHEIKNPLAGIKMVSQLLMNEIPQDNFSNKEYVIVILEEVERLDKLVNELLNFGKHSNQVFEKFDLKDTFKSVLFLLHKDLSTSNIQLKHSFDSEDNMFFGDSMQFKQLFLNLIKNGMIALNKTNKDQKIISVKIHKKESNISICVRDNGTGIKKSNIENIFDLFFTTNKEGSGLGLPVVEKIVKAHNGEIKVSSEFGEYTEICIYLPIIF
ncbi:MAG: ATP-binding protein [Candidatus Muirbacterium halophilum]|nr:ATP-binding protein [Candidatus Muirbacterium halophilum]